MHQCLDLPHSIFNLSAKKFVNEAILVDTKRIIKGPDLDFGDFLQLIGIYLLMPEIWAQT